MALRWDNESKRNQGQGKSKSGWEINKIYAHEERREKTKYFYGSVAIKLCIQTLEVPLLCN